MHDSEHMLEGNLADCSVSRLVEPMTDRDDEIRRLVDHRMLTETIFVTETGAPGLEPGPPG